MYKFNLSYKSKYIVLLLIPTIFVITYLLLPTDNKSYIYKYYTQVKFRLYNKAARKIWQKPIPLSYVSQAKLQQKLASQSTWSKQQIAADFANFNDVSVANVVKTYETFPAEKLVIMFTIKDGKVSVIKNDLKMNGSSEHGLEIYQNIFAYIAKHGYVQNVTFLLRLSDFFGDVPQLKEQNFAPILTTSKDLKAPIDSKLILIPDYMSLEDIPKFTPRILYANKNYPWDEKEDKVLWRGGEADVSGFRHSIVAYSQSHPHSMIDAKFVTDQAGYMPPELQVKAKYLLNIDGHTAAWTRPIWQLLSNSVFLKQDSALIQWYYLALIPDVHYVPISNDPAALETTLNKYSDMQMQVIATAGNQFARENLMIEDMVAYIIQVLQQYEQLQGN